MTHLMLNRPLKIAVALMAGALTGVLGGCASDRMVTGSTVPNTYENRHPITVTEDLATLDILPGGGPGGLTSRQRDEVKAFAQEWRRSGRGLVLIQLPQGGASDSVSLYSARSIRAVLQEGGVPARTISQSGYMASGPAHLAPVRIAFPKLTAKVPHACGQWPADLGHGADWRGEAANEDYWNFGCATQQNLAAMVSDPEDFLRPRAEDETYAPRRSTVLGKYAKGEGTATTYPDSGSSISGVGQGQ